MGSFDKDIKIWKGPDVQFPFPKSAHISELILNTLKETPDRVVQIYHESDSRMTCDELRMKAIRVGQNLSKQMVNDGDVVGFDCGNSEHLIALVCGCILIGAIPNPMALQHDVADLVHMWKITKPKFVFCDAEVYEKVVEALNQLESDAKICTLTECKDDVLFVDDVLAPTGFERYFRPLMCEKPYEKVMALLGSSGTSGPQKAISMTQAYPLQLAQMYREWNMRFTHFGTIAWVYPFAMFIVVALTPLTRILTRQSASPELFLDLVNKYQIEYQLLTPDFLNKILQHISLPLDLPSLKIVVSVGAIASPDLREKFKATFPEKLLCSGYGSTEIIFAWPVSQDNHDGYKVGRVNPDCKVKIVDDDGNALDAGEQGEICGKSIYPFLGYYENPEATKEALDEEGFFKTGDVGFVDEDGILHLLDRKKDIFKYFMHHINPSEIENVIQSMDGVESVVVVEIPNVETSFLACAVVIKKPGFKEMKKEEIVDYVAGKLPEYKQLHGGVLFVDEFPRTSSGKIIKRLIREIAIENLMRK